MKTFAGACIFLAIACPGTARAESAVSCGGTAMLGAAMLLCNHVVPTAPAQFCTFKWSLLTSSGSQKMVEGSFTLPPGASNVQVYQAGGFDRALTNPVILCQGVQGGQ